MSFRMRRAYYRPSFSKRQSVWNLSIFLSDGKPLWSTQERLPRSFMPRPWNRACASFSSSRPWDLGGSQVMEFTGFAFTEQDKGVPVPPLRKNLETRQAGTRMISKLSGASIGPKTLTTKPWEIWWVCPQAPVEVLKIILVIWQKWRVQANLSLWFGRDAEISPWSNPPAPRRRTILYWWEKRGSEEPPLH